jgi:hypothetical protein
MRTTFSMNKRIADLEVVGQGRGRVQVKFPHRLYQLRVILRQAVKPRPHHAQLCIMTVIFLKYFCSMLCPNPHGPFYLLHLTAEGYIWP